MNADRGEAAAGAVAVTIVDGVARNTRVTAHGVAIRVGHAVPGDAGPAALIGCAAGNAIAYDAAVSDRPNRARIRRAGIVEAKVDAVRQAAGNRNAGHTNI